MLQESNSDLLGHRKSFLSAGVTSGVRPSLPPTSERMLSEARLSGPHSRRSWWEDEIPDISCKADIKKQNRTGVCILMEQVLSAW